MTTSPRVAVIGAGVVGANIAYRLSSRGASVMVLDAGRPGHGTSSSSISWLSTFPQIANSTPSIVAYRRAANSRFRWLEDQIGRGWMHWTPTLTWGTAATARRLHRDYLAMSDLSSVRTTSSAELEQIAPGVAVPPDATVYLEEDGGWVDAPQFVGALLAAAERHGAVIRSGASVSELTRVGHAWTVITPAGELVADVIVNAAGIWASQVGALAIAPIPLDLRPGLLVYSKPLRRPLNQVLNGPEVNIRPDPTGGVAIHWRGEDTYTGHGYNATDPHQVIAAASAVLPELRGSAPAGATVGVRPVPPGGPIVGWHPSAPGLFVAVSHGGVGWGPLWGGIAAAAIMDGVDDPRWGAFSPDRFLRDPHVESTPVRAEIGSIPVRP